MSSAIKPVGAESAFANCWQIPSLVVAGLAFLSDLWRMYHVAPKPSFEEQVAYVERLRSAHRVEEARLRQSLASTFCMKPLAECLLGLGHSAEARRSFERLRWLLRTLPDQAFQREPGMPARSTWQEMTERLAQMRLFV